MALSLGCQGGSHTPCEIGTIRAIAGARAGEFPESTWGSGNRGYTAHMALEPLETAEAQSYPTVRQQSIFVENRVGQLLRMGQLLQDTDVRILATSVVYSVDCAIVRMLFDDPDTAYDVLSAARFQVSEAELLAISLPHGKRALLHTWAALLGAEVNIQYMYPLLCRPHDYAAIALCPDDLDGAVRVLTEGQFVLLDHQDLVNTRYDR